jgi:hypothetical protein
MHLETVCRTPCPEFPCPSPLHDRVGAGKRVKGECSKSGVFVRGESRIFSGGGGFVGGGESVGG